MRRLRHDQVLRVAVVGCGRMGSFHARAYAGLPECELIAVVDVIEDRARELAAEVGADAYESVEDLLRHKSGNGVDAVSVVVPTHQHVEVAKALLSRRVSCLIEKPVASTSDSATALLPLANEGTVVQVGHIERFNPAVRAAVALKLNACFIKADRVGFPSERSLDIDVVRDLMIHDIDLTLAFTKGRTLEEVRAVGTEDMASAYLGFEGGLLAGLTASRLGVKSERMVRLFTDDCYIALDCERFEARRMCTEALGRYLELGEVKQRLAPAGARQGKMISELVDIELLTAPEIKWSADPLRAELRDFLAAVRKEKEPEVSISDGIRALQVAEEVLRAIRDSRTIRLRGRTDD